MFGDGTINVTDRLRLIAGLRWTWDDLEFEHTYNFSPITGPGIRSSADPNETECNGVVSLCPGNTRTISDSNSSDEGSGRAGVQFDFTDDFMSYFTYARGYKGPAYNVFFNMRERDAQVLDAETADSYELGLKSTLADGRVVLNGALYSAEYENFQANNFLFLNGVLITTLTNAGTVSTEGFEIDFQARPLDPLTIGGGIAYTDAKVDEFFTPPGSTPTIADGTPLPLAPEWKATLTADYQIELEHARISRPACCSCTRRTSTRT